MWLSCGDFEEAVADALDELPPAVTRLLSNVAILVQDEPDGETPDLLGLYEGVPQTARDTFYAGVLPDRITLFRGPLQRLCSSMPELRHEVRVTVLHEIGHHLGLDEARLHELGWG